MGVYCHLSIAMVAFLPEVLKTSVYCHLSIDMVALLPDTNDVELLPVV